MTENNNNENEKKYIKNSNADFLVFTKNAGDTVEVRVQDNNVWLTQKAVNLTKKTTCAKFAQVADNCKTYQYKFYNLAAIIAVGFRL